MSKKELTIELLRWSALFYIKHLFLDSPLPETTSTT